ncbi:MAG: MFS transporter [Elusimicrobia bacterium RIFOXYB2_FULL_49_7]|nr:MAG: MFS transporter [Elusimicrobia bacterium RIFOXYB2_FULL_49_7]
MPFTFIPTLYFSEGLAYILVNTVSVILYKKMGISNTWIGLTSYLYLPWVLKMLWAPAVDRFATKRSWVLVMQGLMAALFLCFAFMLSKQTSLNLFFVFSIVLFSLVAFVSATHDIAADGFYMLALDNKQQAFFVGIRSFFYRVSMLFGTGVLVVLAGRLETSHTVSYSWMKVFLIAGGLYGLLALYHRFILPKLATDHASRSADTTIVKKTYFVEVFRSYFAQPGVLPVIFFILFYRFGESLLLKMVSPFLLDGRGVGGLGLTTVQVGWVYGTTGLVCLILGGITGGWLISRFGLKKCLWPLVFSIHLPNLFYIYLSHAFPALPVVYALVAVEQFGYGLGLTAFTVVILYFAKGEYKTSHYAISTGIMALGMMVPGMLSGYLQESLGYFHFFVAATFLTLPGIVSIFFLPKALLAPVAK